MKLLRRPPSSVLATVVLMLMGLALVGCGDNPSTLGMFRPEVTNGPDSFLLVATEITDIITTETYTWSNSGTQADIGYVENIYNGTVNVVITDDAGTEVYNKSLTRDFSEPTAAGTAGDWTIVLTLGNVTGTFEFSAEKFVPQPAP